MLSDGKLCAELPAEEASSQLDTAATNIMTYESEGAAETEDTLEYDFHTEAGTPELIQDAPDTRGEGGDPDTYAGENLSLASPKESFSNDDRAEEEMEVDCASQVSLRLHFSQSQDLSLLSCAVPGRGTSGEVGVGMECGGSECEMEPGGGGGGGGSEGSRAASDGVGGGSEATDGVGGRKGAKGATEGARDGVEGEVVKSVESREGDQGMKTALYESIRYSDNESMDDSPYVSNQQDHEMNSQSSDAPHSRQQQGGLSIEVVPINSQTSEVSQLTSSAGDSMYAE